MKTYITNVEITDDAMDTIAEISLFDENSWELSINKIIGWEDVYYIGDVLKHLQKTEGIVKV